MEVLLEHELIAVEPLRIAYRSTREVLVVATSTGTGWIDPDASEALEMMYQGDSAIVSMQYSYLPSWISTLLDKPKVDWVSLARGYGVEAVRVTTCGELAEALAQGLALDGPMLIQAELP